MATANERIAAAARHIIEGKPTAAGTATGYATLLGALCAIDYTTGGAAEQVADWVEHSTRAALTATGQETNQPAPQPDTRRTVNLGEIVRAVHQAYPDPETARG